jgi:hypothetical protein
MSKRNVVVLLIIGWFIFSWPLLIAAGFKPKGSKILFKYITKRFTNPGKLSDPLIICDFEPDKDPEEWDDYLIYDYLWLLL